MNEAIRESLRRELTNAMTCAGIPSPEQAVNIAIDVFEDCFGPVLPTPEQEKAADRIRTMEARYDRESALTFAEREHHKAVERDAILKRRVK
jgi:hypothetical protein